MNPIKARILYGLLGVLAVFCLALSGQVGGQVSSGSGGGGTASPDYYYASTYGASSFTNQGGYGANTRFGDHWTPGVALSISKIGVYLGDDGDATECTVALWTISEGTGTRRACETFIPDFEAAAWYDVDITPYVIAADTEIAVTCNCNNGVEVTWAATSGGYFQMGKTYANECTTGTYAAADDFKHGARIYATPQ